MSCRLGRRSWGADLGEAGPQSREGAQNVGRTICDRSRKFGVEQPSGRGRNGRITAGCYRLFLVTRWGSFAKETARSQCTSEYYNSTRKCTVTAYRRKKWHRRSSITGDNAFGYPFLGAQGVGGFQKSALLIVGTAVPNCSPRSAFLRSYV